MDKRQPKCFHNGSQQNNQDRRCSCIIHAIKNHKLLAFSYLNFYTDEKSPRFVEPYALKEFEHRWYLLAKEHKPKQGEPTMKSFALDRISDLDIKTSSFKRVAYDAAEAYRHSYGIISADADPEEIVLQFDSHQGNYVKTMPLHHSQEILADTDEGLKIKLVLVPTYDFERAVLSYGDRVKILEPKSFKNKMKKEVENMLKGFS